MKLWDRLREVFTASSGGAELPPGPTQSTAPVASALSRTDARTASAIFLLVSDFRGWIRRRVEYIDFIDDVSVRRRVSIDFAVPQPLEGFTEVDEELLPCVPLTFLLKGDVLRNFDLRDAQANPIPMLTKEENGTLAGNSLIYLAEDALEAPLTGGLAPLAERLRFVAEAPLDEAQAEVESWRKVAENQTGEHWAELKKLRDRPAFIEYARILAENYILFAVGPPQPNVRRLMKFGYEEAFKVGMDPDAPEDERLSGWDRFRERLGWRVKTVNLAMPAVNMAASFHVESRPRPTWRSSRRAWPSSATRP